MIFSNPLMAFMAIVGLTNAIETHGGVQFDVRWTNNSSPLNTPIKDTCKILHHLLIIILNYYIALVGLGSKRPP